MMINRWNIFHYFCILHMSLKLQNFTVAQLLSSAIKLKVNKDFSVWRCTWLLYKLILAPTAGKLLLHLSESRWLRLAVQQRLLWAYLEFMLFWKASAYQGKDSGGLNLAFLKMMLPQHIQLCLPGTKPHQSQCFSHGSTRPATLKHHFYGDKVALKKQMLQTTE